MPQSVVTVAGPYCSNCGASVHADARFCSSCGSPTADRLEAESISPSVDPEFRVAPQATLKKDPATHTQPLYMTKPGGPAADPPKAEGKNDAILGLGLLLVGAVVMVIAVFLPQAEVNTFAQIAHNTILQNDTTAGLLIVLGAILAVAIGYRAWTRESATAALGILIGLGALAYALFVGLDKKANLTLCSSLDHSVCVTGSPGIGIYGLGLGGLLVAAGSFGLSRGDFSN